MDGMTSKKNVFVIGATNRPEQLDPALCRPGRLDSLIYVPLPDEAGRLGILSAQLRKTPVADDVNLNYIASKTHGFSGADLGFITQRAVKLAIKESIAIDIQRTKDREAAGEDVEMEDEEDPVPELTKRHFEEAMQMARRSVTDVEIRRYEAFSQQMKNAGPGAYFKFPEGGVEGNAGNTGADNAFGDAGNDDVLYD
jgi:transitional endoplasmic reticulum ATPase